MPFSTPELQSRSFIPRKQRGHCTNSTLVSSFQAASLPHLCKDFTTSQGFSHLLSSSSPHLGPTRTLPGSLISSVRLLQQQSLVTCLCRAVPATAKHTSKYFSPSPSLDHKHQKFRQKLCTGTGYQPVNLHPTSNSFSEQGGGSTWQRGGVSVPRGTQARTHSLPQGDSQQNLRAAWRVPASAALRGTSTCPKPGRTDGDLFLVKGPPPQLAKDPRHQHSAPGWIPPSP